VEIVVAYVIGTLAISIVAVLGVWAVRIRPLEQEHAAIKKRLDAGDLLVMRVARLEAFMRPDTGELAPRLAQLEKQQAVDSRAFAEQARIHHRRIGELDERLQYMARDMRSDRPTARPPRP
jgi:hypothetical protein